MPPTTTVSGCLSLTMHLTSVFVLLSILTVKADDCQSDKSKLAPVRLRKDLLCGYEKSIRPVVNHKDPVRVVMRMILKYFVYDVHDSSFSVDSWIAMYWKDEHLKWDPANYNSLDSTHLSTDDIWMPDISVYNRRDQSGSPAAVDMATCVVSKTGQVVCVPPANQRSLCVGDLTKYPFDTQNCTVRFGSWVHSGEEIDLRLAKPAVTTEDLVPNGEWVLVDTKVFKHPGKFKCCPNNTYPSVNFSFQIKRLSGAHAASVILPAIALIAITLVSLWIRPNHSDRISLCCVNVVCEFLYVQYISWLIPMNGENMALILLFARDSLLLSAFTLVFSVVLKNMVDNDKAAPAWISGTISVVMAFKAGQYILLDDSSMKGIASAQGEDDGAAIVNRNEVKSQDWMIFAKILDRLLFIIYFIVYLFMFIAFTP